MRVIASRAKQKSVSNSLILNF